MPIPSEYEYITKLNDLYMFNYDDWGDTHDWYTTNKKVFGENWAWTDTTPNYALDEVSYLLVGGYDSYLHHYATLPDTPFSSYAHMGFCNGIGRIDVTTNENDVSVSYTNFTEIPYYQFFNNVASFHQHYSYPHVNYYAPENAILIDEFQGGENVFVTSFSTLADAIEHIFNCFANVDLYVNGELWNSASPITYTWQSVPSISGKNGILQALSTLVNINDGNPVSGASASAVNIIPASVVSGMIQTGASDVIVSFEIPQLTSGTYDSIKLVGKRGGIPRSKTDGEFIETLSDSDTSKTLTGLTKGYTYWFVIFAEDSKGSSSESDPYPYETGEGESIVFFEVDLGQGGKDIVRYDATKTIGNHKQGELYGNYTISNDVLNSSDNIYWGYDSTENPKNIPANCTVTFEYDAYFTNGEGYLDWYIIDSNGVEQVYWCFDTQYAFQSDKWYNCKTVCKVENGIIKRYKFVLDDIEISCGTGDKKMPCTDTENSVGVQNIHFRLTRPTKMKNISIYYDFSQYTDGGGGGGGSGASGSNSLS